MAENKNVYGYRLVCTQPHMFSDNLATITSKVYLGDPLNVFEEMEIDIASLNIRTMYGNKDELSLETYAEENIENYRDVYDILDFYKFTESDTPVDRYFHVEKLHIVKV